MPGFATKIDLTHNNTLYVKELKVKHFKILLKCLIDDNNVDDIYYNLINIIEDLTPLQREDIKRLSIIDVLLLIIQLRGISMGGSVQLELLNKKNSIINLNIYRIIEILNEDITFNFTQTLDSVQITYTLPTMEDFLYLKSTSSDFLGIKKYIKEINVDSVCIDVRDLDDKTFLQFFQNLPANYGSSVFKQVTQLIKQLNSINLFKNFPGEDLTLNLTPSNFIFILQILFSNNLMPLYENMFALAKFANIPPEYIEECTPGEYTIFVKTLEHVLKEQNASQKQPSTDHLPPINSSNPNFM